MFPGCRDGNLITELCENALVLGAKVDRAKRSMSLKISLPKPAAPAEIGLMEAAITGEFSLSRCDITPVYPEQKRQDRPGPQKKPDGKKSAAGDIIFGRQIKGESVPISSLTMES